MKQRIKNTLSKKFNNVVFVDFISNIMYVGLKVVYVILRLFLKKGTNMSVEDAMRILQETSPKPEMNCIPKNKKIEKDLSIIVPAFNAQDTIEECIESVINQKINCTYELIIINDGSNDKTRKLVEQYENSNIVLINQENRGFSGARNRGIDECSGRYIMFLDADDKLTKEAADTLYNEIEKHNADIVQGSYYSFVEGDEKKIKHSILEKNIFENEVEKNICNPGFPWAKIYKRSLFNNIRFPLDVWFEDTIVCMLLYRMACKIVVLDKEVYAYRLNPEGITSKARHSKKCIDHYWVMENVLEQAQKLNLSNDSIQYNIVMKHMSTLMYRRVSLMDEEIKRACFVLAQNMLTDIRPKNYKVDGNMMEKDLHRAFQTGNYRLWKLASFLV